MILCKYLPYIKQAVENLAWTIVTGIVVVNAFLYCMIWLFWIFPENIQGFLNTFHMEMVIITSCIFIAISFNKHFNKFLSNRYLVHLGKISFSLYLIHPIILLSVSYLFMDYLSLPIMWVIIFVLPVVTAHFTYTYFEGPVNNFGRKLSNKFFRPTAKVPG
ncbi:MAG: hypothetical protein K0Q79_3651 [Flavipsychrobacter sp.]|nr:hypothetical protein [Flavipsychrobacter sp.]